MLNCGRLVDLDELEATGWLADSVEGADCPLLEEDWLAEIGKERDPADVGCVDCPRLDGS